MRLMMTGLLAAGLLAGTLTELPAADDGKQTYLSREAAGETWQLQGEYVGAYVGKENTDTPAFGVQVIALGNGKFRGVGYVGGLPGAGWNGEEKITAEGELVDGVVKFKSDRFEGRLKDGKLEVLEPGSGQVVGTAKRADRQSRTLAAAPPEGAIVLFDSENPQETVKNWQGGKLVEDKYLGVGTQTKEKFGDFRLHMEFWLPFMPAARGQGRANSGVYLQHRYECQILDSFGLTGENNECGGFYKIAAPRVNMCLPPLNWQTYDFDFTAAKYENGQKVSPAKVTVLHNAVVIHEDLELPNATAGGKPESPEGGPIFLQNHGNPVMFRNIWIEKK